MLWILLLLLHCCPSSSHSTWNPYHPIIIKIERMQYLSLILPLFPVLRTLPFLPCVALVIIAKSDHATPFFRWLWNHNLYDRRPLNFSRKPLNSKDISRSDSSTSWFRLPLNIFPCLRCRFEILWIEKIYDMENICKPANHLWIVTYMHAKWSTSELSYKLACVVRHIFPSFKISSLNFVNGVLQF